jgi:hypothetical protein
MSESTALHHPPAGLTGNISIPPVVQVFVTEDDRWSLCHTCAWPHITDPRPESSAFMHAMKHPGHDVRSYRRVETRYIREIPEGAADPEAVQ